jgi:hypothetical protein
MQLEHAHCLIASNCRCWNLQSASRCMNTLFRIKSHSAILQLYDSIVQISVFLSYGLARDDRILFLWHKSIVVHQTWSRLVAIPHDVSAPLFA